MRFIQIYGFTTLKIQIFCYTLIFITHILRNNWPHDEKIGGFFFRAVENILCIAKAFIRRTNLYQLKELKLNDE